MSTTDQHGGGRGVAAQIARQLGDPYSRLYRVADAMDLVIARARTRAERRERETVAAEVREAVRRVGLTRAELASRLGTSASRLPTYRSGHVHGPAAPAAG